MKEHRNALYYSGVSILSNMSIPLGQKDRKRDQDGMKVQGLAGIQDS